MSVIPEIEAANAKYAEAFAKTEKGSLPLPPGRKFAVLACMDARMDVAALLGLSEGDAHVIRNAGGRADDSAIRSLVISHKLLGTQEYIVIHHTDCGMEYFDQGVMASLLEKDLVSAEIAVENGAVVFKPVGQPGTGSVEGKYVNWLSFKGVENSVREDIARIKSHSLINKSIPITGYVYDVKTGKLIRVD